MAVAVYACGAFSVARETGGWLLRRPRLREFFDRGGFLVVAMQLGVN